MSAQYGIEPGTPYKAGFVVPEESDTRDRTIESPRLPKGTVVRSRSRGYNRVHYPWRWTTKLIVVSFLAGMLTALLMLVALRGDLAGVMLFSVPVVGVLLAVLNMVTRDGSRT